MTITNFLLFMHVLGAGITGFMVIFSFVLILLNKSALYRNISIGLAGMTLFQIITGSLISLLSADSVATYCTRIALYMSIVLVTEIALFWKMKLGLYPFRFVFASVTVSFVITLVTAVGIYLS